MAVVIEVSPGPNFFLIIRSVPIFGKIGALAIFAGFGLAYTMHGTLAIYGVSALLAAEPLLLSVIQIAGAGYLLHMGIKSLGPVRERTKSSGIVAETVDILLVPASDLLAVKINSTAVRTKQVLSSGGTCLSSISHVDIVLDSAVRKTCFTGLFTCFRDGLIICALNPKITLFYLAVFPQFIQASVDAVVFSFILVLTHILICGLWIVVVTHLLDYALKKKDSEHYVGVLTRYSGVALVGLAGAFFNSAMQSV